LCKPIISGSNSSKILDPVKHSLDSISVAVQIRRETVLPAPVALWRNIGRGAFVLDLSPDSISIVAFITMQKRCFVELIEQNVGCGAVGNMAAGQQKPDGTAETVGQGMDFGGASTTRATDRLIFLPPFPPDAQRCAFTAEESISTSAGGPPAAAKAWKISIQTPLADQRTKRLYSVLRGP
jgi:hypothetical protein